MRLKLIAALAAVLLTAACGESKQEVASAGATAAPGSVAHFQQSAGDRVFFDTDRSDLNPTARDTLNKQAAWLKQYGDKYNVTIEGHADERGTREYNLALGARRAASVKNYLTAQGIPAAKLGTISYGKERPEVVGSDEGAWARNRRAVTALGQ